MGSAVDVSKLLEPILIMSACYFLLNSSLTAVAIAMETGTPVVQLWRKHFLPLSLNSFVGASVAAVIVQNTERISFATFGIILPLLVVSYLTFKASMGRVEDANRHLADLNQLYLSTVETLAMAIDAKDQVTHGHIRRVQSLAVGLAKSLGIDDPKLLRGIEAAALLHDMGKLAVPDYILNKPGTLTDAEFEKMKLHATVGAEILSTIDFPYPVVPMVRHHHEHWDGTGYPDGLSGTDIPVGARILSVVDCFDALTSDRPYRPKVSDEEALRILEERKGTTYDPAIVEAFMADYESLSRTKLSGDSHARALFEIARSSRETAKEPQMRPQTTGATSGESTK